MREAWFYCPMLQPGRVVLVESETRHAVQSLRLRPGDSVTLFDGQGHLARATILDDVAGRPAEPGAQTTNRRRRRPITLVVDAVQNVPSSARTLTLVVPGCKGARLDWLIEKGTELGVSRFILAELERTVVHAGPQHGRKLERTAIAACKQCHRAWLPRIQSGVPLGQAVQAVAGAALLVAHLSCEAPTLAKWLATHHSDAANLAVVIGPEGGLAPAELDALMAAGGQLVCLAEHILRVETAALAVAACWAADAVAP